jgi:hypothetical protein
VEHNAVISGGGYVSFTDCYFSNNNNTTHHSVVAEGGKLQIHNCTFDALASRRVPGKAWAHDGPRTQPPSIHLKPGVKHAIVQGNNGYYGVEIKNDIGDKAMISNNEPFHPES